MGPRWDNMRPRQDGWQDDRPPQRWSDNIWGGKGGNRLPERKDFGGGLVATRNAKAKGRDLPPRIAQCVREKKVVEIKNMPEGCTVKNILSCFANTTDVHVNGNYAYVVLESANDAQYVKDQYDGGEMNGSTIEITVL